MASPRLYLGIKKTIRSSWVRFSTAVAIILLINLPAGAMADDFLATGTYIGDGSASQAITGVGFQPDLVIVKSPESKHSHIRTSSMPAGLSKHLAKADELKTDEIVSLDSDGFTVGDKNDSNASGVEYHWIAMIAREGTMEIGQYIGNGGIFREISLSNLSPDAALIMSSNRKLPVFRHTEMNTFDGFALDGSGEVSSSFAYFTDNGMVILSGDEVNKNGDTFYYVAWQAEPNVLEFGKYTGDGQPGRDISSLSLNPEHLMISSDTQNEPIHRPESVTGDVSLYYSNRSTQNNLIQAMWDGGFQIGTDPAVNGLDNTYHWLAFANPVPTADLSIAANADNLIPLVGETVTLTVAATNLGPDLATGVQLTNALPIGLTFQSSTPSQGNFDSGSGLWDIGTIGIGQSETLIITASVDAGTNGTTLTNTAEVTASTQYDSDTSNNSAVIDITVLAGSGADLEVSMTVSDDTPDEGQSFIYQIAVTNNGPDNSTNVQLTDAIPVNLHFSSSTASQGSYNSVTGVWDVTSVNVGETHTLDITVDPDQGTSGSTITNTIAITALDQTDPNNSNDSATVDIIVNSADMQILKLVDDSTPLEGDTINYTILATNLGPSGATNVKVDDVLPAGVSYVSATPSQGTYDDGSGLWNIGTMASTDTQNLIITATVDAATAGSTITNTATLNGISQAELNPANNTSSADITVSAMGAVDLQLTKAVDNPAPNVGETVTYTVTLLNNGVGDATGIEVMDILPAEVSFVSAMTNKGSFSDAYGTWAVGDLADGFQAVLNILALVESSAIGTTVTNIASISAADQTDPDNSNNTASIDFNTPTCDMSITNIVDDPTPTVGQTVVFTMTVTNDGPNAASGIQITHALPTGTTFDSVSMSTGTYDDATGIWEFPSLNPGLSNFLVVHALVQPDAAGSTLSNTASISSTDQADPDYSNNTANASITVPGADLALDLTSIVAVAFEGTEVDFNLTLQNDGPNNASAIEVTQLVPAGLTIATATPSQGSYDQGTGLWDVGLLNNGISATLDITVTVDSGTAGTIIASAASITAGDPADPDSSNNTDTVSITVPNGVPSGNSIWPLVGTAANVLPGAQLQQQVLTFAFTNQSAQTDTLHSMTITNLTAGEGTLAQMDAEWQPLTLTYQRSTPLPGDKPIDKMFESFTDGLAIFDDLNVIIAPGDTLEVTLQSNASLEARDSAHLQMGILESAGLDFSAAYALVLDWPLVSGHILNVNGFVWAQAAVVPMESGLLAIGSLQNLALTVDLPNNGYLDDTLYGLSLKNNGSAQPVSDISAMHIWSDEGDGVFGADDILMGSAIHSGDRWQLTGLSVPVPSTGLRIFTTVDIAETALPSRDIRLSLPVGNGYAVEMFSGNDGPVDVSLENPSTLGISDTDRIILFAEWSLSGTTLPGTKDATLLQFLLTNTYADERQLQSLTFSNTTEAVGSTADQRDATCQQVYLVLDENDNGELDDVTVDSRLASGIYVDGQAVFGGLDLSLAAGAGTRLFVTSDLGLNTVADGNRIKGQLQSISDINIPGSTVVATWPLESGAEWLINGMVADQITNQHVNILTLGPGEGPVLAMDLSIPANGYAADELIGISLVNEGSATAGDLLLAELWEDGGDGVFNAGMGDDISLGPLNLTGNTWTSTVLSRTIDVDGMQLFTSLTVSESPQDSVTVKLGLPIGGVTVSSGNDGPVDESVPGTSNLVISTSPLRTVVVFDESATNTGQNGSITMSIRNAGSDTVTDILPVLTFATGENLLSLFAPSPSIISALAPDDEATFTWQYTSDNPGVVVMEGNVQGVVNGSQVRRSIITPTSVHQIFTPVPQLDLYPTANLPFSINRGQQGVVPLTLTFINPGGPQVADAALSSIRIRLLESVDGAGIVPSDLLENVVVAEGTNIYYESSQIPSSGSEINLEFSNDVIITGSEPVTLSLRLDLRLNSAVPSFLISIEDATWLVSNDAVDHASLTVVPGEGTFPVRTGQATLVSQAVGLNVAVNSQAPGNTIPGQNEIVLAEINLSQTVADDSSSSIDLGRLAFEFHDVDGHPLNDPAQYFSNLSLESAFQVHFSGPPTVEEDSLVVLQLSAPVTISGSTNLVLRLVGNLSEDSPLGQITPLLGPVDYFDARDGNMNNPVPVFFTTEPEGPVLNILEPASSLTLMGSGTMPAQISQGTRDLAALTLTLANPGQESSSSATCDTLVLNFYDAARQPLATTPYLDRIRIMHGTVELATQIDPVSINGIVSMPLTGLALAPAEQADLRITLDFKPDAPTGTMELVLSGDGVRAFDAISGQALEILPADGGSLPISSSVATIVAPADELTVAVTNMMPPLLVPDETFRPVFSLEFTNPAAENSGGVQINALTLSQNAAKAGTPILGEVLGSVQLLQDGSIVASTIEIDAASTFVTLTPDSPLVVDADQSVELVVEFLLKPDAPPGALSLILTEDGVDAGPPGGAGTAVRVLAASGQTFPFISESGNIGAATLAESYANFPNPFAAGREPTTFAFSLQQDAQVNLRIMTPHGELVATILDNEHRPAGFYQDDLWQGYNGNGSPVHNGVYLAELVVRYSDGTNERILRKVAVVR